MCECEYKRCLECLDRDVEALKGIRGSDPTVPVLGQISQLRHLTYLAESIVGSLN